MKQKVLIVDDDQDTRYIYDEFLSDEGIEVDLAADGMEGFHKILKDGYDLVILDIMMPKVDGLDILKKIQALPDNEPGKKTPIVMLSALDQQHVVDEAKSLGAVGFISKSSLTPDQVLVKIREFLHLKKV